MYEWKGKASNAILMDEVPGKGRAFECKFLEAGLVKYSFGVCLLPEEALQKFAYNFVGCPVIIDHQDLTDENADKARVGVISDVNYSDGWYWCRGIIFDNDAIELINQGYNVSCQYEITEYAENKEGKLHNGNPYDKVILNGKPEHLAIVKNPRYENAMIAVNAIEIEEVKPNIIIEAINAIKETDMFKNLFNKKEKTMDKEEMKSLFMECLLEAKNAEDEEKEKKEAENEDDELKEKEEEEKKEDAENKCKNEDEPDYKKLYEELKAKVEAKNEEEEEKKEKEEAKNSIDEQAALFTSQIEAKSSSNYISKAQAIELGNKLF